MSGDESERFLRALFGRSGPAPGTEIEVRAIDPRSGRAGSRSSPSIAGALATIAAWRANFHVYVGVATRRPRGRGARDCVLARHLWLDLDFRGRERREVERPALRALARLGLEPEMVVHSGRGLHHYFRLSKPYRFETAEARATFQRVLRALALDVGADPASTDVARIMRVAGTLNQKTQPPAPVRIESLAKRAKAVDLAALEARIAPPRPARVRPLPIRAASGGGAILRDHAAFVARLEEIGSARQGARSWTCPGHDDERASMVVREKPNGSVFFWCYVCQRETFSRVMKRIRFG